MTYQVLGFCCLQTSGCDDDNLIVFPPKADDNSLYMNTGKLDPSVEPLLISTPPFKCASYDDLIGVGADVLGDPALALCNV